MDKSANVNVCTFCLGDKRTTSTAITDGATVSPILMSNVDGKSLLSSQIIHSKHKTSSSRSSSLVKTSNSNELNRRKAGKTSANTSSVKLVARHLSSEDENECDSGIMLGNSMDLTIETDHCKSATNTLGNYDTIKSNHNIIGVGPNYHPKKKFISNNYYN